MLTGIAIVAFAATMTYIGFKLSEQQTNRAVCESYGHVWEPDYTGLECRRCKQRF